MKALFQFSFQLSQGTAYSFEKSATKAMFSRFAGAQLGFVEFRGLISHEGTFNFYHGSEAF